MSILKKNGEQLPEEVKAAMKEMAAKDGRQQTKELHAAVTNLGFARKEMEAALQDREQLHCAWQSYVHDAILRWETWTQEFTTQDTAMSVRIQEAQEALQTARAAFVEQKANAGVPIEVDQEEDEDELRPATDSQIAEQMSMMKEALKNVKNKATELYEEHIKKKQKVGGGIGEPAKSSQSPAALPSQVPFGNARS